MGHLQKKLTPNTHCPDKFVPRNYTKHHSIPSLTAGSNSYPYRCVLSSDSKGEKTHTIKGAMHVGRHTHLHTCIYTCLHTHVHTLTHTLLASSFPTHFVTPSTPLCPQNACIASLENKEKTVSCYKGELYVFVQQI